MNQQFQGGYYILNEPLIRGFGANAHTAKDLSKIGQYAVEAVNLIQDTPWEINPFMLDIVKIVQEREVNLSIKKGDKTEVILRVEQPLSPRNDPFEVAMKKIDPKVWESMDKDSKKGVRERRARCLSRYEEDLGSYRATLRMINTASEMSQFDKFYFPHNMDFRTRIYPIPTDLTPQSSDLSKGLLRFFRGTRLGPEGHYWMGVTVATHWGEDKLAMDKRFLFAASEDFLAMCSNWVDDPLKNRGWLEADKPFQFLAVAHEWVWANRLEDPESFISYLPGNLDGSCNGAQHLSIMARDEVGAEATNCMSIIARKDLYLEVADKVWEIVQRDAEAGDPLAIEWTPKMFEVSARRKVVKRAVMTVPYGVTEYGVADFMIKDKHVEDAANKWDAARYMRDLIMASIDETLSNGRALQRWFQACAVKVAEAGLPLCWDTPAGTKVTQAYRNLIEKQIKAFDTRFVIYIEPEEDEDINSFHGRVGMNVNKMGTSAPPNVVHSCDASHLQITTCRMGEVGIKDFSMIHDSFGCPFAHVGLMRDILRRAIVDMYSGDYLQTWKESVELYSGMEMPSPPPLGDFEIMEILESQYFFS